MKSMIRVLVFTVCCVSAGCGKGAPMVLMLEDVQNFNVSDSSNGEVTQLRISGLAFHSSLAVDKITTQVDGSNLLVKVELVPARGDLSGRFDYPVDIPSNVKRVYFGDMKHQIWPPTP
jgi:hypothetical protein